MSDPETKISEAQLEALFQDARANPPELSQAAMAQIVSDAVAFQPVPPQPGWRGWWAALGGAPGLGGLVTATCVGFWIGIAPPETLPDLGGLVLGEDASTLAEDADGFGWDIEEG